MGETDQIINSIGALRTHLANGVKPSREVSIAITKLDEAMLWLGVESLKVKNDAEPEDGSLEIGGN